MSSDPLHPGLPITSLESLISTVRTLNDRSIYHSKPRTRFLDASVTLPDPFIEYDGKPISRLYLESHASVSQYDWYHSFTLCFHDDLSSPPSCDGLVSHESGDSSGKGGKGGDKGGGKRLKEIRGYGYLDFRACQKVYYTALIEEFVLSLVQDDSDEETTQQGGDDDDDDTDWKSDQVTLVDTEKSLGAKLVDAIKQRGTSSSSSRSNTKMSKEDGEEEENEDKKRYIFNLKITTRPETSFANWHKVRFGYYDLEESYELRRTYNVRFNVEKGVWPNTNGYTKYDYLVKIDTDKSPFPEEARQAVRHGEYVWEKVFFAKVNEPYLDGDE